MPRGIFPWYLQRFEPVHCGRALCVHCTCTVRALSKHTHVPAEAGNIQHFAAAMNGRRGKQKEIAKLQLSHVSVYELALSSKAVKNPENIST